MIPPNWADGKRLEVVIEIAAKCPGDNWCGRRWSRHELLQLLP
jgi:hypothetical protein